MKNFLIVILFLISSPLHALEFTLLPIEADGPVRPIAGKLLVQGLDKDGHINSKVTTVLSFRFEGKYKIDPENTRIEIFTNKNSENIKHWFDFDSKKIKYSLKQYALKKLIDKLKAATNANITISISSSDFEKVDNFNQVLSWKEE